MNHKYKCIIFDMDGTLVDSLQGILNAINYVFKEFNINVERSYKEGLSYIGAGAETFARRAIKGINLTTEKETQILTRFLERYKETQKVDAELYSGIKELILDLKKANYKVAIATNKPQVLLEPLIEQLFGDFKFDILLGGRLNKPVKPDPFIIFEIMKELNLKDDDCLYIGDSEYDYLTAKNAGIDCMIVKYGYGFYENEWMRGVKLTADKVEDIRKVLLLEDKSC